MPDFLPGTEVTARGLRWEVVETQNQGDQTRVRIRGLDAFSGFEVDVLYPFEDIQPVIHELNPSKADRLANWIVYHQAFLLEQALGSDAFLVVQPGRLRIEPYQLVPLARALRMSRPRLLLADDVGLGKTIEAGLVIAEMMARRQVHRLLVVTPAGPLLEQWQDEMLDRFGLRLDEIDRSALEQTRRGVELGANPFDHIPLGIASVDFLKQDRVLDELERALPYDMVVIDEAHHCSDTGQNARDRSDSSQRRKLAEVLARQSDALLLLTATPHDGYDRSFASLLELLDPSLVDSKGKPREESYRPHLVRRLKKHIKVIHPKTGERVNFPERTLIPIEIKATNEKYGRYAALHQSMLEFIAPALRRAIRRRAFDDALAFLALLKRSTSSVKAVLNTLNVVRDRMVELQSQKAEEIESAQQRRKSLKSLQRKMARFGTLTLEEEAERELLEKEELAQQLTLLERETRQETRESARITSLTEALNALVAKAEAAIDQDAKVQMLIDQIRTIRASEPRANILIYTEYLDSLRVIEQRIKDERFGTVLTIHGDAQDGSPIQYRKTVTERFRNFDNQILVSTDAASEGLNLHDRCHQLIHFELPWNPNRLEQRNGRIDRYGQWEVPVIRYMYLANTFEERILARLLAKYERQRQRLKFMPNTLGMDANDLPLDGLLSVLMDNHPAPAILSQGEGVEDDDSPEVRALLDEVESSLKRFEDVAKTYKWLGAEGEAADELAQRQASRSLEIGQKVGDVDLVGFVRGAVLSEGGRVVPSLQWIDIYPPRSWFFGMDHMPGWNPDLGRFRVTTDMEIRFDDQRNPVGYLGRAHVLVRRAIEHVRHLEFGQNSGLDRRVSAAVSKSGKNALVFTFLGKVNSQMGREYERMFSIRVMDSGEMNILSGDTAWMPDASDGVLTKGVWENKFSSWGIEAQDKAQAAAHASFESITAEFTARHQTQMQQERRDLDTWLDQRVTELLGRQEAVLPLFEAVVLQPQSSLDRLKEFIARSERTSRERNEATTVLKIYSSRAEMLNRRMVLFNSEIKQIGLLMLVEN